MIRVSATNRAKTYHYLHVPSSFTPLSSLRYLNTSNEINRLDSIHAIVTLGNAHYLITSGSSIAACTGSMDVAKRFMQGLAAPRTAISETALLLETPHIAFREGALLRPVDRIAIGSDGYRHLIENAQEQS